MESILRGVFEESQRKAPSQGFQDIRYKIQDIYYEFSAHIGAYTDASKCTNK